MPGKIFSKKEALSHGIQMTRKYLGVLLPCMLILISFEVGKWLMNSRAGSDYIRKNEIPLLYRNSTVAEDFRQYLLNSGYINESGQVQDVLKDVTSASDLTLAPEFEADRSKIFNFLRSHVYRLPFPRPVYYVLLLLGYALYLLTIVGWLKICLTASRDQQPQVGDLFSNGRLVLTYTCSAVCYMLAVMGGFVLLIIPGIILAIMYGMNGYFIVDQQMGPIEALKASRALTKGARWQLFCFGALIFLFNIVGLLCLLVGVIFTATAGAVAMAHVYDKLREQDEVLSGPLLAL